VNRPYPPERGPATNLSPGRTCDDGGVTDPGVRDVPIDGDMTRLGQFLKFSGAMDSGGEAKVRVAAGEVRVNGEIEVHRGRQLRRGDVITFGGRRLRVA
jgi:ribosome-associated protein